MCVTKYQNHQSWIFHENGKTTKIRLNSVDLILLKRVHFVCVSTLMYIINFITSQATIG